VQAARTLREVLHTIARMFAPFTPFFAESLYARVPHLQESVHLDHWPETLSLTEAETVAIAEMERVRAVIELGLSLRAGAKIKIRQPLALLAVDQEFGEAYQEIICDELNVKQVVASKTDDGAWVEMTQNGYTVALCTTIDEALQHEGIIRELTRTINGMRKTGGLTLQDRILVQIEGDDSVWGVVERASAELVQNTLATGVSRGEGLTGETLQTDLGSLTVFIERV
jgi:isoleucyl-tRNA synthetase